ncbi:MAG TPA: heavy metal-responsive transcriptional regulator [bacterium]|nr:heavy metal-responsive transcriptional regulator [bacterium]
MDRIQLSLQIGEVARQSGTAVDTIRYYEKKGLLDPPVRSAGGFRLYPAGVVQRLLFIRKAQALGLTLKEIKRITCCGDQGLGPCCDLTVDLFSAKIREFEGKIAELQGMKKKLKTVLGGWVGPTKRKSGRRA